MRIVNIHEAKTHLSKLLEEVSLGGEIVIAKSGKPMARLTGISPAKPIRKPGFLKWKSKSPITSMLHYRMICWPCGIHPILWHHEN